MDDESRQTLQGLAGAEVGLPTGLHARIAGESISQMRSDAAQLAEQLGLRGSGRDAHAKFTSRDLSAAIRRAAGRTT